MPCVWVAGGRCCSELSLAARGSARVFRSRRYTERTAWLHRWQIIERVEKLEECSPAHNCLLKNVHHAPSLPTCQRSQNPRRSPVFPAIRAGLHIIQGTHAVYMTHLQDQPWLRLKPQSCKCANGNNSSTTGLLLRFSFYVLLARLGPLALQILLVQHAML